MKKVLCVLVFLVAVMAICLLNPVEAKAASASVSDLTFTLNSDGQSYAVTDCGISASGALTIPSTYYGLPVTKIGYQAFKYCYRLTSVTIPDSVTSIGRYAFYSCDSLTSVTIGNGVTSIGRYAFYSCDSLTGIWVAEGNPNYSSDAHGVLFNKAKTTLICAPGGISGSYTIPDSVTSIGSYAFYSCDSLTNVTIPDSVISIGDYAFAYCDSLTSVTIGNGVTSIGSYAFYYCSSLTSVTIPDSVTSIGSYAFYDCSRLTSVTIPDSVTSIGSSAFAYCSRLTSVTIGNGVTSIGNYAFYNCDSLTSITIPDSVTSIGSYAFYNCNSLTSVTIGNGVTSIGSGAFYSCDSLTSVTIPDSVTSIGSGAFSYCKSLTGILVSEGNPNYSSDDYGVLFNKAKTELICAPGGISGSYTIPDSVTSIGSRAFDGCNKLTSITLGNGVTSIGDFAFYSCSSLTSITIGNGVTSIGEEAFEYCSSLATVYYRGDESDRQSIAIGTSNNSLSNAQWYYNVCIGNTTHAYDNTCDTTCNVCSAMRTVPAHVYDNACDTTCNVCSAMRTVPDHVYDNACDTTCNVCSATRTVPAHVYDNACDKTCNVCSATRTVPAHVYDNACDKTCNVCAATRTVPAHVYSNACDKTCNVCSATRTVPAHVYDNACDKTCNVCSATRSITHTYDNRCDTSCNICGAKRSPSHLYTNDYDTTCNRCSATRKPDFLEYKIIKNGAQVWDCNTRVYGSLTIPNTLGGYPVTAIADDAFRGCEDLSDVIIPYGVTFIGEDAFYGCRSLVSITIPASVTEIDSWAFYNCDNLSDVYYAGSQEQWGQISIGTMNEDLTSATIHFGNAGNTRITSQPKAAKVKVGGTAKFTVKATGTKLKYQWQYSTNGTTWKNCSSSSAKKASFSFTAKTSHIGNYYRCIITDADGNKLYTSAARIYVLNISTQPKTQMVEAGEKIKFTVKATGTGLKYQWQYSTNGKTWKNCSSSSAKKATFTFTGKTSHDGNNYRCKVTDSAGNTVYTSKVRAYVLGIEEQPVKKTVTKGKTAKFSVEATGHSLTYQWQYSTDGGKTWKNCSSSSAKKAIFSFTAKTSYNGNYYRCRITDSAGNRVYTSKVKLTVKK